MLAVFRSPRTWAVLLGLVVVLVIVVVVATSGGGQDEAGDEIKDIPRSPDTPIVVLADEPIIIGVSTALTGPIAEGGSEHRDAVIVGVERWKEANGDQIAGHDIEIHAEDDGCFEADITEDATERLLGRQGLVGVIGPDCSAGAERVIPIYSAAGIVAISGSVTKTDLTTGRPENGFFFRTAFRNDLEGTLIGLFLAVQLEAEKVYIIDDSEPFGIDLADAAQAIAEAGGVEVIRESIVQGAVDFSDLAARIAADNPDFVGFTGFNPEAALLYRQIRDAGYDGLFGAGDGAASQTAFVEPVGEAAEGALFSGCQYPPSEDFLADFVELHGHEPEWVWSPQYADAVTVLLGAVKEVAEEEADGSLVIEPRALRDAVRASDLEGITGSLAFDSNGDRVPEPDDELENVMEYAFLVEAADTFTVLGLIPCQVQDGELVPLAGPGAGEIRLP